MSNQTALLPVVDDSVNSGEPATSGKVEFKAGSRVCTYLLTAPRTTINLPYNAPEGLVLQYNLVTGSNISTVVFQSVPVQAVVVNALGAYVPRQYDFLTETPGLTFTLGLRDPDVGDFLVLTGGPFGYSEPVGTEVRSYKWTSVRLHKRGVIPRGTHYIRAGQLAAYAMGADKLHHAQWVATHDVQIIVS